MQLLPDGRPAHTKVPADHLDVDLVPTLQTGHHLGEGGLRLDAVTPKPPAPTPTLVPDVPLPPAEALPYVERTAWGATICSYEWDCGTATRVFHCENPRHDPTAVSYTGDHGIAQINAATWAAWLNERGFDWDNEWFIVEKNVAMAHTIWLNSGWGPWSCF